MRVMYFKKCHFLMWFFFMFLALTSKSVYRFYLSSLRGVASLPLQGISEACGKKTVCNNMQHTVASKIKKTPEDNLLRVSESFSVPSH